MSGDNYPDKIDNQLESIEKKVDHLSEGIEDSSELDQNDLEEIRRRNRKFGDELGYLMQSLRETYEDWTAITDVLSTAQNSMVGSAGGDWDDDLKRINIEDFVRYIAKVYYCTDQETYEEIKMDEDDVKWLFVPQRKMVDEIEDWDNEKFADDDERKSMIEERVDELIEDPWGGKSMKQSVIEFEERYEEEVVNN
ncbi:hypothetical protein [Halonotius sp. GCM10025705]|uniref:hypothetical protein n=1 Tax=Halonotius sp. GCM10025705 TaxID=3252678 RepID=UPI00360707A5